MAGITIPRPPPPERLVVLVEGSIIITTSRGSGFGREICVLCRGRLWAGKTWRGGGLLAPLLLWLLIRMGEGSRRRRLSRGF